MQERTRIPILGVTVIAGIGLDQFGGIALVVAIFALVAMSLSIIFVWNRVRQLSEQTSDLTEGVESLTDKISELESTMKTSDALGE